MLGRGFLTFLPEYRILDNQYLGVLIDTGFVGLVALLGLFVTGAVTAQHLRSRLDNTGDRQLARALMASVASAGVSFALFDAFSFPMASGLVFLLLGAIDALRRLTWFEKDGPRAPAINDHAISRTELSARSH
jgi:O-antigen ligase